jgi:hypothetical protein
MKFFSNSNKQGRMISASSSEESNSIMNVNVNQQPQQQQQQMPFAELKDKPKKRRLFLWSSKNRTKLQPQLQLRTKVIMEPALLVNEEPSSSASHLVNYELHKKSSSEPSTNTNTKTKKKSRLRRLLSRLSVSVKNAKKRTRRTTTTTTTTTTTSNTTTTTEEESQSRALVPYRGDLAALRNLPLVDRDRSGGTADLSHDDDDQFMAFMAMDISSTYSETAEDSTVVASNRSGVITRILCHSLSSIVEDTTLREVKMWRNAASDLLLLS